MTDPLRERAAAALKELYEIEAEIGRGGMSVVYKARDLRLNRDVAIKVLPPELAYDAQVRSRFTREAQTAAQLSHPHIVPIYDVGEREGIAYLVMAWVGGGSLAALLVREPKQPVGEVKRLVGEIADALAYAHQRGVVHRDIKPDNILLDQHSGRAMVTDFGIARAMESTTRLTATGNAVGTPAYMSPEQAVGERTVDGRSDIYSLGVLAWQMLAGRLPFRAANPMALLMKHVGEAAPPLGDHRPDAPRSLRQAVERALMKEPDDRWPTASAMREAIDDEGKGPVWRAETREPVRYVSPPRGEPAAPRASDDALRPPAPGLVSVPPHLAALTPEQRADLRLWHGRVTLMERIKGLRGYTVLTIGSIFGGMGAIAAAVDDVPPAILLLAIPAVMSVKWWKRAMSLRAQGVKLRRSLFMPRAKWVIPAPVVPKADIQLGKLAPKAVLESPQGAAIRRAVEEKAAILELVGQLSKEDRAMLPDIAPTVDALVERVAHVAGALLRLDQGMDRRMEAELDAQIAAAERGTDSPEGQRQLALLRRQRATFDELHQRRAALARQLDSAGMALRNLRLDLIKLRSSGLQSALSDVSTATQEARALSREIGTVLDAAAEVRSL